MVVFRSLRGKLITATLTVQILVSLLLVWNGERLLEIQLIKQSELRLRELTTLLQASLATPLVQRDYAGAYDILLASQTREGLVYLVLRDTEGRVVARIGWPQDRPLPEAHSAFSAAAVNTASRFDMRIPIAIEGLSFGDLSFGVDLAFMQRARREHLFQTLLIALAGTFASLLVMMILANWLTRDLRRLTRASQALAAGLPYPSIEVRSQDEIGFLARNFEGMATALAQRMTDLEGAGREQRILAENLEEERARLAALLSSVRFGLVFESHDRKVTYINPAFAALWGFGAAHAAPGLALDQLVSAMADNCTDRLPEAQCPLLFATPDAVGEFHLNSGRVVTQTAIPVTASGGAVSGRLWIFEDVTAERQAADRLLFLAERDPLTGLFNRTRFDEELQRLQSRHERDGAVSAALLYCDLDEFKVINDTYGHSSGDEVLKRVAQELRHLVRGGEVLARLGGDEFAILTTRIDRTGAETLARRMLQTVDDLSFEFQGQRHRIGASIGVALFPEHAESVEALVSHADAAMYEAKRGGKNSWRIYSSAGDTSSQAILQMSWNERIDTALEQNLLVPYFQGIYSLKDRVLSYIEVLLRMRDPQAPDTLFMPAQFIVAAERSQRIVAIDRWVVVAALQRLAADAGLRPLAVNLSARSIADPEMAPFIIGQLRERGVKPQRLLLEIKETAAIGNIEAASTFVTAMRQAGCSVCLDEFGTGFSSLAHLKQLDVDILKIDGMFIQSLAQDSSDQMFVRLLIEMARSLGKRTVAEFVENDETIELLESLGADCVQGYQLGRPGPQPPLT